MKKLFFILPLLIAFFLGGAMVFADGNLSWTGQGTSNGVLNSVECDDQNTGYLQWNFTLGGNNSISSATLTLGGTGSGSYPMTLTGGVMKVDTPFFTLNGLTASVSYVGTLGNGNPNLTISHGCPGVTTPEKHLACVNNACVEVDGAGANTCQVDNDCITDVCPDQGIQTSVDECDEEEDVCKDRTATNYGEPEECDYDNEEECPDGQVSYNQNGINICISCPGGGDCEVIIGDVTPTPTPTATPTATVTPTSTPNNDNGDDNNNGVGGVTTSEKQGEVLGVTTLPQTGNFASVLATIEQALGVSFVTLGAMLYGKKKVAKTSK